MMTFSNRSIGIIQVILSGICYGFLGYFGKQAYLAGLKPGEFLALRFLLASICLVLFLLFKKTKISHLKLSDWFKLALLGILGYAVFSSCYFYALSGLSASLTVLLLYIYPVLVAICGSLFLNEMLSRKGWLAVMLATVGLVGLVWGEIRVDRAEALLAGFGSAIFYSFYILASRKWTKLMDPIVAAAGIQFSAGAVLFLIYFNDLSRPMDLFFQNTLLLFGIAIISTVFAMTLFLSGLSKLKSSEASVLSSTEPIATILIAMVLLGEHMMPIQILGGILVLISMILISIYGSPPKK